MGLLPENSLLPVTANAKMLAQSLKARQQPRTQLTGQGLLDTAAIGLSPVPIVGDALGLAADASRFYNEPESRTPLNFGLAALGAIPFIPPLVSMGLGKLAQSQGKTLTAPSMSGPARNQAGAIVYHGSPHKFDQFDSSKIGTGEGAQAYGHGLYFAENPSVARQYQKDLSGYEQPFLKIGNERRAGQELTDADLKMIKYLERGKQMAGQFPHNTEYYAAQVAEKAGDTAAAELLKKNKWNAQTGYEKVNGSLYKVDLPDEAIAKMLDYDAPLSKQPEAVKNALLGARETTEFVNKANDFGKKFNSSIDVNDLTGAKILNFLGSQKSNTYGLGSEKDAADYLNKLGIPGIRYLDGGSMDAGKGTRNYVVFPGNEGLLKILERQ